MIDIVDGNSILKHLFRDKEYYTHIQLIHVFHDEAENEVSNRNPVFDQDYKWGSFMNYYHSVFYQYLILYTVTLEHIFDTLHNTKGKVCESTLECVNSIYELNPSFLCRYTDRKETITTFRDGLFDEIEGMMFKLILYCEEHNYSEMARTALIHWLQLFHAEIEIGTTKEDTERLLGLISEGNNLWPNCISSIWNLICEIIYKQNNRTLQ